jgi:geranylgeranyl pyrophosphate synthase
MITTFTDPIQERLQQVETLIYSYLDSNHSALAIALYQLVASGGKRIRPRIALLTGNMLGADPEQLLFLAAAIEMLHTATLVHDDLIDNATLRRGLATLNAHWSSAATTLTGDFAFACAAQLAVQTNSLPVMRLFTETLQVMVGEEIIQLSSKKGITCREDYYRWIQAKTASLFELATGAAAFLSPVDEEVVVAARKFGYEIGMAFQIVDDVLDFIGNQFAMGKPIGNDLRQGIITLPTLYYFEAHPGDPDICAMINRESGDTHRPERLLSAISQNGAIEKAMQEAECFVQRGLVALAVLPVTPERQALAEIAWQIVQRKS